MYPDLKIKDQLDIIRIINNFLKMKTIAKKHKIKKLVIQVQIF